MLTIDGPNRQICDISTKLTDRKEYYLHRQPTYTAKRGGPPCRGVLAVTDMGPGNGVVDPETGSGGLTVPW